MTQAAAQHETTREHLVERLRESRERYLSVAGNVPAEAVGFRSAADSWSILEVAEHVAVAERQMLTMWTKLAQAGEGDPGKDAAMARVADRTRKAVAPERSRPSGRYQSLADAVRDFTANREQTIAYAETHFDELRGKIVEHPLAGKLDGYQLLLLMAGHAERHAAQMAEQKQGFQEKH
jgi:hypothetical protein